MGLWNRIKSALGSDEPAQPAMKDPIDAFWAWWADSRDALAGAIADGTLDSWVEPISARVSAIHEDLAWELGHGKRSQHHICVSSEGSPVLRVIAERWRSRAPEPDDVWEYYAARQPSDWRRGQLDIAGAELDFPAFRLGLEVDERRLRVHLAVFHPALAGLPEKAASTALFVTLDRVLGEDGTERWVGAVTRAEAEPEGAVDFGGLLEAVERLEEADADSWVLGEGQIEGHPLVFTSNMALKRVDHLLFDVYSQVHLTYGDLREDGLPDSGALELFGDAFEVLEGQLGHEALFLGTSSSQGVRTYHWRTPNQGRAAAIIDAWAEQELRWPIEVEHNLDPTWEAHPPFLA